MFGPTGKAFDIKRLNKMKEIKNDSRNQKNSLYNRHV